MRAPLFWHVASVEARKRMSYRLDFWTTALIGLSVHAGVSALIVRAIFSASGADRIGGFTPSGLVAYLVIASLVAKLVTVNEMEMTVSQDIYDGGLSRYLVYPASYAGVKYAQQLGATAPALVQCAVFVAWMPFVFGMPEGVTFASAAMGAGSVLVATLLQFLLTLPIQAVAFWAENVWSLTVAYRIVSRLAGGFMLPLALFPGWLQASLAWTPFPYLFAFPTNVLLGHVRPADWLAGTGIALAWCAAAALVARAVWRRGDLQYTGVGM